VTSNWRKISILLNKNLIRIFHPLEYQKFDIFNSAYEILPLEKSEAGKQTVLGLSIVI
jgi:hypothetical protein